MKQQNQTKHYRQYWILLRHIKIEECQIHKFWEIESYGTEMDSKNSALDEMTAYQDASIKLEENKYIAKFPWKHDHLELPSNETVARRRTQNVINRLAKEPEMLKLYGRIIEDQQSRGFIEKVEVTENKQPNNRIHYIPHHPVRKDLSTTPIRVVYDCSCRQDSYSPSLNDCLSSTPPQLNQLTDILTRFRFGKIRHYIRYRESLPTYWTSRKGQRCHTFFLAVRSEWPT